MEAATFVSGHLDTPIDRIRKRTTAPSENLWMKQTYTLYLFCGNCCSFAKKKIKVVAVLRRLCISRGSILRGYGDIFINGEIVLQQNYRLYSHNKLCCEVIKKQCSCRNRSPNTNQLIRNDYV